MMTNNADSEVKARPSPECRHTQRLQFLRLHPCRTRAWKNDDFLVDDVNFDTTAARISADIECLYRLLQGESVRNERFDV